MKRHLLLCLLCGSLMLSAQVTTRPAIIQKGYTGEVTIVFNPNEGNRGMADASVCYAHTGITYNGQAWQKANAQWRDGLDKYKMTRNPEGCWELQISPSIYDFYGVPASTPITQLCFVFNDGPNGSKEGKDATGGDIFVNLADEGLTAILSASPDKSLFFEGDSVCISAFVSETANLTLSVNDSVLATAAQTTAISYTYACTQKGSFSVQLIATNEHGSIVKQLPITVIGDTEQRPIPEGINLGINYDSLDRSRVTLCMFAAANKRPKDNSVLAPAKAVFVVGDFNNWKISPDYQMYRDSCRFWLPVSELKNGREYAYQYVVIRPDGIEKRISDAFAEKQLHPDDQYEPKKVNPNLKAYPKQGEGYVSVLQTGKQRYQWDDATLRFQRPDKNNLIIYELWVYDFTPERSFAGVMRRLPYLQKLGVNAIELMPVCEFDGNYNWGYSPNHYFALDKAYGTPNQFKQLIDSCHARGMAVIMDMVFNHATGLNPQNKLYPYGDDLKWNPWFNVTPPHGDVFYQDWNHDFPEVQEMFVRALQYWLTEYKVDGFRMDLSHGFCGKTNQSVPHILDYYHRGVQAVTPDAYFILEHWGSRMNQEREQLIREGMLCWHNINNAYSQLAMGWISNDNLAEANRDGYVSYCESHDEERNQYKALTYGKPIVRDNLAFRLSRIPLTVAFNVLLNGPHMIWQYNELGFDYSINSSQGKSTIDESQRCDIKEQPEALGWLTDSLRMAQYERVAAIINLRTHTLPSLFAGNPTSAMLQAGKAVKNILWENDSLRLFMTGNFSAEELLPTAIPDGTWYDFFTGTKYDGGETPLAPGELLLLLSDQRFIPPVDTMQEVSLAAYPTYTQRYVRFSKPTDVWVYDASGRLWLSAEEAAYIDLNGLAEGFYFLRFPTPKGQRRHSIKVYKY